MRDRMDMDFRVMVTGHDMPIWCGKIADAMDKASCTAMVREVCDLTGRDWNDEGVIVEQYVWDRDELDNLCDPSWELATDIKDTIWYCVTDFE